MYKLEIKEQALEIPLLHASKERGQDFACRKVKENICGGFFYRIPTVTEF